MNERDRKRVSDLVREEFRHRWSQLHKDPTPGELAAAKKLVIGDLGIGKQLAELKRASARANELTELLCDRLRPLSNKHKRYGAGGDVEQLLEAAAQERLRGAAIEADSAALKAAERLVLARVALAASRDDLRDVCESLGLVETAR